MKLISAAFAVLAMAFMCWFAWDNTKRLRRCPDGRKHDWQRVYTTAGAWNECKRCGMTCD